MSAAGIAAWQRAIDLSIELGKAAPWECVSADAILGIRDPVSREADWCTVMGHAGEVFGVAIYPGDDGFATLQRLLDDDVDEFDAAITQRAITLTFESASTLAPATKKLMKVLGRAFRGGRAWPELLLHEPGLAPAPALGEVRLQRVANTLCGLNSLLGWARNDPNGSASADDEHAWVTSPPFGEGDRQQQKLPILATKPSTPPPYDRLAVERVRAGNAARRGKWFLDWFPGHGVIDGPEAEGRPFFICHVVLLDLENGLMLATEIGRVATIASDIQHLLLRSFIKSGLPETLLVRRQEVAEMLGPLVQALGIPMHRDARLCEVTREVHEGLTSFLAR